MSVSRSDQVPKVLEPVSFPPGGRSFLTAPILLFLLLLSVLLSSFWLQDCFLNSPKKHFFLRSSDSCLQVIFKIATFLVAKKSLLKYKGDPVPALLRIL